jgi:hypothetical protein
MVTRRRERLNKRRTAGLQRKGRGGATCGKCNAEHPLKHKSLYGRAPRDSQYCFKHVCKYDPDQVCGLLKTATTVPCEKDALPHSSFCSTHKDREAACARQKAPRATGLRRTCLSFECKKLRTASSGLCQEHENQLQTQLQSEPNPSPVSRPGLSKKCLVMGRAKCTAFAMVGDIVCRKHALSCLKCAQDKPLVKSHFCADCEGKCLACEKQQEKGATYYCWEHNKTNQVVSSREGWGVLQSLSCSSIEGALVLGPAGPSTNEGTGTWIIQAPKTRGYGLNAEGEYAKNNDGSITFTITEEGIGFDVGERPLNVVPTLQNQYDVTLTPSAVESSLPTRLNAVFSVSRLETAMTLPSELPGNKIYDETPTSEMLEQELQAHIERYYFAHPSELWEVITQASSKCTTCKDLVATELQLRQQMRNTTFVRQNEPTEITRDKLRKIPEVVQSQRVLSNRTMIDHLKVMHLNDFPRFYNRTYFFKSVPETTKEDSLEHYVKTYCFRLTGNVIHNVGSATGKAEDDLRIHKMIESVARLTRARVLVLGPAGPSTKCVQNKPAPTHDGVSTVKASSAYVQKVKQNIVTAKKWNSWCDQKLNKLEFKKRFGLCGNKHPCVTSAYKFDDALRYDLWGGKRNTKRKGNPKRKGNRKRSKRSTRTRHLAHVRHTRGKKLRKTSNTSNTSRMRRL